MAKKTQKQKTGKVRRSAPQIPFREQTQAEGSSPASAIIMTTLAVGAAGIIGYFGWQYYKKQRNRKVSNLEEELIKTTPTTNSTGNDNIVLPSGETIPKPDTSNGGKGSGNTHTGGGNYSPPSPGFPLKKGSKGELVRKMQEALIGKYGKSILPKYGADGDFGTETATGLAKAGFPATVNESIYNVIIQGGGNSSGSGTTNSQANLKSLGQKLYSAAAAKSFNSAISLLKQLKNQDDYSQASEAFKQYRLRMVRQTLVNGMLSTFTTADQKQKIRLEFLRMGLKYDGSKWSLSGFDGRPIVTKEATTVWVNPTQSLQVPSMMVLGVEVAQRLDYTMFENNNKFFLVPTRSIKYL
ncbi:MAG TPA: hypothetical protein VEB40_14475 [Flavipsychrobacter sp.]|nr:hypothetical protein [Flavipsychrobacter sp.]